MLDLLLVNGRYPDFDSGLIKDGNIGVSEGKIAYIGSDTPDAKEVIDVCGHIISPGFIDIHMHEENFAAEGEKYVIAQMMLEMGVTTALGGNCGNSRQSLRYFKEVLERLGGAPINYAMLSGYNSNRKWLGIEKREASKEERDKINAIIKQEIDEEGSFGISFGIEYDVSITTEEMIYALKDINDPNLLVTAHIRGGCVKDIEPIEEFFALAEGKPMKYQISHLGSMAAMGNMAEALKKINEMIDAEPDKYNYDIYPYNAFSTRIGTASFDEEFFDEWGMDYGDIMLTDDPYRNMYCDKELYDKVRAEYPNMLAVGFIMKDHEIVAAMQNRHGMIASDATIANGKGHPRAAGTFPRFLGKYVREEKVVPLIRGIEMITLEPAKRLGLDKKGRIALGADADITVFDPDTILDGADFSTLDIKPTGIDYVFIGGKLALDHNVTINDRLGKYIPR
ncbi:MAG: amidohydrolase family protein [Firmicutes bacterium]|nr:amidohydrolase family protein [Bacillota bacterium]